MFIRIIFILSFFILSCSSALAKVEFTWSQVIPNNKLSIRAIVTDSKVCPNIVVDGKKHVMHVRNESEDLGKVCELIVSDKSKRITVNNIVVPTLPAKVNKIAIIGDTGCQVSWLSHQNCVNDWFAKHIMDKIILHAPDIVIHVGDYFYRETKCFVESFCGDGKVYGDNFLSWKHDWFDPASNLLKHSAFLFVRGNHENCSRGYKGWFNYLDSYPYNNECKDFTDSWFFNTENLRFFVFDSSFGKDILSPYYIEYLDKQISILSKITDNKPIWFVTHRPFWGYSRIIKKKLNYYGTLSHDKILASKLPKQVNAILSGHVHVNQILHMKNGLKQFIVGNSGSSLNECITKSDGVIYNVTLGQSVAKQIRSIPGFGFAILELDRRVISFYNKDNTLMFIQKI